MAFHYTNAKREEDSYALADVEVFYADEGAIRDEDNEASPAGWYYWFCFPGCMPEGEASGPYESEEAALKAARESAGCCEHGVEEEEICEECPAPELWTLKNENGDYLHVSVGPLHRSSWAACWSSKQAAEDARTTHGLSGPFWFAERLSDEDAKRWGRS